MPGPRGSHRLIWSGHSPEEWEVRSTAKQQENDSRTARGLGDHAIRNRFIPRPLLSCTAPRLGPPEVNTQMTPVVSLFAHASHNNGHRIPIAGPTRGARKAIEAASSPSSPRWSGQPRFRLGSRRRRVLLRAEMTDPTRSPNADRGVGNGEVTPHLRESPEEKTAASWHVGVPLVRSCCSGVAT